jgi:hypothetical protein
MININGTFKYVDVENGEKIRIIEIVDTIVYFVNIEADTSMPKKEHLGKLNEELETKKMIKIKDPFIRIIADKDLSEIERAKRDKDWELVKKYWQDNKIYILDKAERALVFKKIKEETGMSLIKIKRLFSRFWQRGMNKNSLIPDYINSGGKGKEKCLSEAKVGKPKNVDYYGNKIEGINVTSEVKRHFEFSLNKYYRNNKKSIKESYTLMLRDFYSNSYKENGEVKYRIWEKSRIPTYDQFYYWFKKNEDIKKDIIFRKGQNEFDLKERELLSDSKQETDGPGTRFQVDATVADIYLVSSLNRNRVIGRPILYAIIDVYSRLVTGIYVGLEGPSWLGAMMALDNMICDKVEFCKKYGINIEEEQWPCQHLPDIIIADRGEFEGYSVENLINNMGIIIENTPPYRGDLKGIVERSFRTTNEKIKHLTPGAIQKEFRKRGDKDYRLDATLTLHEFTKILINMVLYHNSKIIDKYEMDKEMLEKEIPPIPLQIWKWGMEDKKGRLDTIDRDIFRLNILPRGQASISRAGIKFKGLYYSSDKAIKEQWFIKSRIRSIEIVYDPRKISSIYILHSNGEDYDECYLTSMSIQYKDCILEEVIFNHELLSEIKEREAREQNQNDIDIDKEINEIVRKAQKERKNDINYNESSRQKLKEINKNRSIERAINRENESFSFSEGKGNEKVPEIIEVNNSVDNKLLEMIKRKRNEKK